jgi:glycosyltransferase involved in cell wall biosynthesis
MSADPLRILILAPFPPRTDGRHGGSRVTAGLVKALARRHHVALLHLDEEGGDGIDDEVAGACEVVVSCRVRRRPAGGPRARWWRVRTLALLLLGRPRWVTQASTRSCGGQLRRLVREFRPDVVQVEFAVMTQYLREIGKMPAARVLVQHEPSAARATEVATSRLPRRRRARLAAWVEARAWRRFEIQALKRVDAGVVFTDADAESLRALGTTTAVHVIPFGIDVPASALDAAGSSDAATVAFVGNFVHKPNVEAAQRLVRDILPLVHRKRPDVQVLVIGRAPPAELKALGGDGVLVTGEVASVTPYVDRANVVVAPLETGGGMRVKVVEALAAGKAVVATPRAAAGLPVVDRQHLYIAESDGEIARALLELLADAGTRVALGTNARTWALAHAGWDETVEGYERLYRSIMRQP